MGRITKDDRFVNGLTNWGAFVLLGNVVTQ